jgi:hypothetical protein
MNDTQRPLTDALHSNGHAPAPGLRLLAPAALAALVLTGLLTGCASRALPPGAIAPGQAVRVVGQLTDNGLGCQSVRTADGTVYTLARGLEGVEYGQTLQLDGYVTEMKRDCGYGTPVMPQRAVRVQASPTSGS